MRALSFFPSKQSIITHFRRTPIHLLSRAPSASPPPPIPQTRSLHGLPSTPFVPPPSKILQSIPAPTPKSDEGEDEDEPMNEFISRFAWAIRGKLSDAYPGVGRETLDGMLLLICQKVADTMDHPGSPAPAPAADSSGVDLSSDLWKTVWDVSNSVHEAMRRDRMREDLKKYLHCDEVKEMSRFASDVGIRGSLLREFRFKWAREKLEEVDFYRDLERMRAQGKREEEGKNLLEAGGSADEIAGGGKSAVTALPQRRGKIKYKIYGLDLSEPEWAKVAEKAEEAEKQFVPEEAQPIVGRCKKVDDRILALDAEKDDPSPVLAEWAEILQPKRVDWLALLERIKKHSNDLYLKVAELLLSEESFGANIRDYSRLMDAHSKAGRLGDAERILQKMTERGIMPDVLTSIILLHMYSKAGDIDRAKEAFESLNQHGFHPNLEAYKSMITAYVKAGLPKQGETLIREMEFKDIKPTNDIYLEVLRAFAERGQVDGAQRIVNTMQFAGIKPTTESYTLLVEAYTRAGDPDQARGHFDHMMKSGHRPDDRCTASMMAAYVKKNLLDKALDLLLNLEKDGFQPGIATNTVLVDWLGRLQLVEEVEILLSAIREKGEAPFEINVSLCDMYARARLEEKTRRYVKTLEGRKELLSADQFERIVSGLLAGGLVGEATRIYDVMLAQGFSPSDAIRMSLMAAQSIPRQKPVTRRGGKA